MPGTGLNTNVCPSASECDDDDEQFDAEAKAKADDKRHFAAIDERLALEAKAKADERHFAAIDKRLALEARERKPNRKLGLNNNFSPYEPRTPFSTRARAGTPVDPNAPSPKFEPRPRSGQKSTREHVIQTNVIDRNKFLMFGLVVGLILGSVAGIGIVAVLGVDQAYWVASLFIGSLAGGSLGYRADNTENKRSVSEPMPKRSGRRHSTGSYADNGLNLSKGQHGSKVKTRVSANDIVDKRLARKNCPRSQRVSVAGDQAERFKLGSMGRAG